MQIKTIIDRLCSYYQLDKKKDLADKLGVNPSVISNWLSRNTIDWKIIFTKCENINYNWLLFGEGEIERGSGCESPIYKKLFESQKTEIKELNREIGKLQQVVEQLKKGSPPTSYGMVAESELKFKKGK